MKIQAKFTNLFNNHNNNNNNLHNIENHQKIILIMAENKL